MALVGKKAPYLSVGAVINGEEIVENFSLDQYIGKKHVILFFYPKDRHQDLVLWRLVEKKPSDLSYL